jgi:hypothetical protein
LIGQHGPNAAGPVRDYVASLRAAVNGAQKEKIA